MDKQATVRARTLLATVLVAVALVVAYLVGHAGGGEARAALEEDQARTVTVQGIGSVSVAPDQVGFDLSVNLLRPDLSTALDEADAAMRSVVDALVAAGVPESDVQTTDVSTYPDYARGGRGEPPTLRGYRVNHSISVTVDELSRASEVIAAGLDAGGAGVRLDGVRLQVADPESALEPARGDALDQARAKAEEYAARSGLELGDVLRISETVDRAFHELDVEASYAADAADMAIQPGQQDLTASVVVVYALG